MSNLTYQEWCELTERYSRPYEGFTVQPHIYELMLEELAQDAPISVGLLGFPVTSLRLPFETLIVTRQKEPCRQWNDRRAMLKFVRRTERSRFFTRRHIRRKIIR